ncbi:hypothetical protein MKQ70_06655 [Chitinophaga sedimenti]|uniref:hypothetical protein n=1 Tax=Chitinophaga sedimenti TaxID=2033606 RepID=UPI00200483E6|nr:hypothetical protein [Chitinophaga sedimenti]MCK7554697.1 hypothetical protein [Chitinophaga sedimenti]
MSPGVRIDAAMNFVGPSNVSITSNGPSTGLTQFYIMKPTGYTVTLQDDFNNSLAYIFPRSGGVNMSGRTVNLNGMDDGSSASPLTMNITGATITGAWRYMAANKTLLAANSVLKARRFLVNGGAYDVVDASGGTASDAYVFSTTVNSLLFSNPSGASAISVGSNNTIRRLEFKGRGQSRVIIPSIH